MSPTVPRQLPTAVLDREITGRGLDSHSTLGSLLAAGRRPTVLVFLRHYG